jgi:O-antigen/teichoic acid export membrane protein
VFQRLRALGRDLAVYGAGDVATQAISFLLLPVYVRFLSPGDYGVLALLLTVEMLTKIVFRWGVDASFMRMYYDCPDVAARRSLASTIFYFLLAANGAVLAIALVATPVLARHLFGSPSQATALQVLLVNTFLSGFFFIPFHELRIQRQAQRFIALTMTRSLATILLRLTLVIWFELGVIGVVLADLFTTVLFGALMLPRFAALIGPLFSRKLLREALRFGLPRIPHGLAQQTVAVSDRYVLSLYATLHEIGLYSIGASFAMGLKLFLNAFEYAWAPFYFAIMREPDAKPTYRLVATWGTAVLVGLAMLVSAGAPQIVRIMTTPLFHGAAVVMPWIAVAVVLQGVYLLTSIGLNITKRTEFYPMATGLAAATSVGMNLVLVPRFGVTGAAIATSISYAVLTTTSAVFANRVYPVDYEWTRIARIGAAGLAGYALAVLLVPVTWPAIAGLLARSVAASAVYTALLALTGFLTSTEQRQLAHIWQTVRRGQRRPGRPAEVEAEVSETLELAGNVVSATAGEAIDGDAAAPFDARTDQSAPGARRE